MAKSHCEEPVPGDLIEIFSPGSEHWAICVGDGYVVHLAPPSSSNKILGLGKKAVVKRELLKTLAAGCRFQVNNHLDDQFQPWPVNQILSAAGEKIGTKYESEVWRNKCMLFVTYLRYGLACGEPFCDKPEPGDLIEIYQFNNKHWAIYDGEDYVIHLVPTGEKTGLEFMPKFFPGNKAVVKRQRLQDVVKDCSYRINNHLDSQFQPWSVSKILSAAKEKVGKELAYSDWSKQSEHFALYLRYGLACSESFCKDPEPGDLIEVFRSDHTHWAICVKSGSVVHLDPPGDNPGSDSSSRMVVKREALRGMTGDCAYRVNNYLDDKYTPLSVNKIVRTSKDKARKQMQYSVNDRKCKSFVIYLRYGLMCSEPFCEEPQQGDLIEIFCTDYEQWGIFVGDGSVVCLTPPSDKSTSASFNKGQRNRTVVKKEFLKDLVGDFPYRVNNHLDDKYPPHPVNKILSASMEKTGKKLECNVQNSSGNFVVYLRYGLIYREPFCDDPEPGDLVEIFRDGFQHWAISMGDGSVIHLAPSSDRRGFEFPNTFLGLSCRAAVKKELLKDVVGDSPYRVNNCLDSKHTPLPVNQILSAAKQKVGQEMDYSAQSKSCENLVTELRYGVICNEPVKSGITDLLGAIVSPFWKK